jgi:hypothetical protein
MEKNELLKLKILYLQILQDGKVRPDRGGAGSVRDAKYNIPDIDVLKMSINMDLGLDYMLIEQIRLKHNINE